MTTPTPNPAPADPSIEEQIAAVERAVEHYADYARNLAEINREHGDEGSLGVEQMLVESTLAGLQSTAATLRSHAALEAKVRELEARIEAANRNAASRHRLFDRVLARATSAEAERDRAREVIEACKKEFEDMEDRAPVDPMCGECNVGTLPHRRTCARHQVYAFLRSTPAPVKEGA